MEDVSFLNTLKMKYDYSDKLMVALDKIIPKLILFYGNKYEKLIKKAISSTVIIECNSYQSLSSIIDMLNVTKENKDKALSKENLKLLSSIYIADPVIKYDEMLGNYVISDVKRYIILSHFHNLDSPRGLATLTHELVKLIRSFSGEYHLDNDILYKREGLKVSKKKITKSDDKNGVKLVLLNELNTGLELGINSYEEEAITSLVIGDKYETFDYDLPKKVAFILYQRLNLKDIAIASALLGDDSLKNAYDIEEGLFISLAKFVDMAVIYEDENHNLDITKAQKEELEKSLKGLGQEIGNNLIFYINALKITKEHAY